MSDLGSIYGKKIDGSNTLVIDFSNVDICGNLKINGGLAIDNSFGVSGEVLKSNGSTAPPSWVDIYNLIYPVDSVFIWHNDTNNWGGFPGQTWLEFAHGRTLVGRDQTDGDFNNVGDTGGSKTHALSVSEMPRHTHTQNPHGHVQQQTIARNTPNGMIVGIAADGSYTQVRANGGTQVETATNQYTGGNSAQSQGPGEAHNNLQPFYVVRYYRRTA